MKVLVTGATGLVGKALCERLLNDGYSPRAAVRTMGAALATLDLDTAIVGDINELTDWHTTLLGVDVVVHLAARVHVMRDRAGNPLDEFRRVNVQGTFQLARSACAAGVERFIFMSSVKVNGEFTKPGQAFTEHTPSNPMDAYGQSKHEAEISLQKMAEESGMEVVIVRPPLVYGPGVKANFATMMRWLQRGVPLPLGAIHNQRSLVAIDNLVDLIVLCLKHPAAANQTFLVSDGEDVSTTELLFRMGQAMGCPARLLALPSSVLKLAGALLGKSDVVQRLCGSLQVDITKTQDLLGWTPPVSLGEGLRRTALGSPR